jgi:acyl-[acyl-carrier-protein]-phospholipid O-acyltransferase/long-chain-fatty-acid--[acyl-carrier-protein] ligase
MRDPSQKLPGSFGWLNATQFCGALNDNLFKFFIVFFLIHAAGEGSESLVNAIAGVVFVVPFLIFVAAAGVLADRLSKRNIVVAVKAAEVGVMSLGALAFFSGQAWALYGVLFLMATQSAFFGPSKFGIVPELVGRERLSKANGYLQAFTYLAIIIGTFLAPTLGKAFDRNYALASLFCVGMAAVGLGAATRIPLTPAAGSDARMSWLFVRDIARTLWGIRRDGFLVLAVLGSAYFLAVGAFMQLNIIPFGRQALGRSAEDSAMIFLLAAVGIGLGSVLAGKLSGRNVEFGLVPFGALGLTAGTLGMHLAVSPPVLAQGVWIAPGSQVILTCCLVALTGLSAGIFIVPIQAFIQYRTPREKLGEVLAASGFLSWCGVLMASVMLFVFSEVLGMSAGQGYFIIGWVTLGLTVISFVVLPDFLLRFLVLLFTRSAYRLRIRGLEHVPVDGPALLVANHAAWADALLVIACTQRRIKFLMARSMYRRLWWIRPFLDLAGVIPVSGKDDRSRIDASLNEAREQLEAGYMVCIFAEGTLTRNGLLRRFKSGFARIVKGSDFPIIPVFIGGAWGSISSYYYGPLFSRLPQRLPFPIAVWFGEPMPADSTPEEVRLRVQELACASVDDRKGDRRPLAERFLVTARRSWARPAMSDSTGRSLTFGQAASAMVGLAEQMEREFSGETRIGILLPPSVAGALANLGASACGKAPVNLNLTSSPEALRHAYRLADLKSVISSRAVLERVGDQPLPDRVVLIEDLLERVRGAGRFRTGFRSRFVPARWVVPSQGFRGDDVAAILFSSGSTGLPKGIQLSHHNILSNIEAMGDLMRLEARDVICGILPLFHSFGFGLTLWMPLIAGCSVAYHANSREPRKVVSWIREKRCTFLMTTPALLRAYGRRAEPGDLATIRACISGAERLPEGTAEMYQSLTGRPVLEGYGATELSPVASCNVPSVEIDGIEQIGHKPGSVGHPLPGVVVRIVDPETRDPLPAGQDGRVLVKGPSVMVGYLNDLQATEDAIRDGWYDTGDIGRLDEDGFLILTDRLSRFSKIGGEMVPHGAVEERLLSALETEERAVAVTAVPDPRKGERLVVLYTPQAGDPQRLRDIVSSSDLPNLWQPGPDAYLCVDRIPVLGSGKLDLHALKALAAKKAAAGEG